jgi:uncharacterized protein DUF4062
MKSVYVSSTFKDLEQHRKAVTEALRRMGYAVHCMEDYVATDERTDARCTKDIAACDFYVGIIAQRYGWRPAAEGPSITELEYHQARSQTDRTQCLLFLLDEEAPWPQKWIDALGTGESAARDAKDLKRLRADLAPFSPKSFTTLDGLVREVMAALHVEDERTWKRSLEREMSRIFAECKVVPSLAPGDLGAYKMYLNASGKENIITLLQATIRSLPWVRVVGVDLVGEGGWWPTRLLLLAGLLASYSSAERLVFSAASNYVGMCSPWDVRRALAAHFPAVEKALAESLPEVPGFDPAADIRRVVDSFSERLNGQENNTAVGAHVVVGFRGFEPHRLRYAPNQNEMVRLAQILQQSGPHVAVEEPTTGWTTRRSWATSRRWSSSSACWSDAATLSSSRRERVSRSRESDTMTVGGDLLRGCPEGAGRCRDPIRPGRWRRRDPPRCAANDGGP